MMPRKPMPEPSSKTRLDMIDSDNEIISVSERKFIFQIDFLQSTWVRDEVLRKHIARKPCPEASGAIFNCST